MPVDIVVRRHLTLATVARPVATAADLVAQDAHLRTFLLIVTPIAFGLAIIHGIAFLAFDSINNGIAAVLVCSYVAILIASWIALRRGYRRTAVALVGGGLLAMAIPMAAIVPSAAGLAPLVPLIVVALVLPYMPRQGVLGLAGGCWIAGVAIAIIQAVFPPASDAPVRFVITLQIGYAMAGLGLFLFVLLQFDRRQRGAFARSAIVNRALHESQDTVKRVNRELKRQVAELEDRNREASLVTQMSGLLEVSRTSEEAYAVIGRAARMLFPKTSGSLLVLPASRHVVDVVATWGDRDAAGRVYRPEDCWALRQGRMHVVDVDAEVPGCAHVEDHGAAAYMCIPMTAQGAMIGVFHVAINGPAGVVHVAIGPGDQVAHTETRITGPARHLAQWVAELLALSLANFRLRETLELQSTRDPLTGLYNRRYMEESLERELYRAGRVSESVGVIMADLDHFKAFNDAAGHVAGDGLLRSLGEVLRANVRAEDIVCRYGGEEFIIILPEATLDETARRAEILRGAASRVALPDGRSVTISLGVAAFPDDGTSPGQVVEAADAAMYRAKADGRDRVVASRS